MVEFADQSAAIRVRDAVATLAKKAMNEVRPGNLYGQVVSIDHAGGICKVVFPGATEPTQVNLGMLARPHAATLGVEGGDGALVEIAGTPGNYRVVDVLFGSAHLYQSVLDTPSIGSSAEKHVTTFSMWVNEAAIVGNQTHVGRFENTGSVLGEGGFLVKMIVEQPLASDIMKVYEFSVGATGGFWRPLVEKFASGPNAVMYNAEIKVDSTGFDLRLRRIYGAGGNYRVTLWIYGADYVLNLDLAMSEMSDAQPTMDTTLTYVNSDKDGPVGAYPFFNSLQHAYQNRPVQQFNSGGTFTWDGTRLNWDATIQCVIGMGWHDSTGILSLSVPVNGAFLTVHGSSTGTTSAVNASGINMQVESRTALYYEPILGGDGTSASGRYHLVCSSEEFTIPAHWIFIAEAGSQTVSPTLRLCTGELMDHWKDINLAAASAVDNGATPQWKWQSRGMVALRGGLHRTSATYVQGDTMMTMPVAARPPVPRWLVGQTDVAVYGRGGGFRIQTDGTVTNNTGPAANQPNVFYFDGVVYSV